MKKVEKIRKSIAKFNDTTWAVWCITSLVLTIIDIVEFIRSKN